MIDTNLIFILGSGRCGTKALVKMLQGTDDIEAHHEYCRYAYQREAVLYAMHYLGKPIMEGRLRNIYKSAAWYSEASQFLDSSHKLVPCVDLLVDLFPNAKFIHLVRDGRKVVASFYYKLLHIQDDRAARLLREWVESPGDRPVPPPSEKFWFIPPPDRNYNRLQRLAWMWTEYNNRIERALDGARNKLFIRLEDVTGYEDALKGLIDFIGVPYTDIYWKALNRPDHVYVPINYKLTDEQYQQFNEIAAPMMERYDYTGKEKDVRY